MTKLQIVIGILLFAAVTAVLYVWGLRKSLGQQDELARILLSRCTNQVLRYLKKHDSVSKRQVASLIKGVTANEFWSKKRLTVQDANKFSGQVLQFMTEQQYIEPDGNGNYRLKK